MMMKNRDVPSHPLVSPFKQAQVDIEALGNGMVLYRSPSHLLLVHNT